MRPPQPYPTFYSAGGVRLRIKVKISNKISEIPEQRGVAYFSFYAPELAMKESSDPNHREIASHDLPSTSAINIAQPRSYTICTFIIHHTNSAYHARTNNHCIFMSSTLPNSLPET